MARIIAALIGGVLIGILAMFAVSRFGPANNQTPDEVTRDIVDVPKMAQAVADNHRDEQYASLTSIEDIVALPTEFSRAEAIYTLAGRSNSADVQKLIFEANRVADEVERSHLLNILFSRLAETDPPSALVLARTEHFNQIKSIEQTVWQTWARNDLDDALFAAKTQSSVAHRNLAAQSLYGAFGYMGNANTDRIEAELEIGPDRSSRARYLYRLADKSPAEAVGFINGLEHDVGRQEFVSWLAYYLALRDPVDALRYADLFADTSDRQNYRSVLNANIARADPRAAIERFLAGGPGREKGRGIFEAARALASTDFDAVMAYFEQARSDEERQVLGVAIAMEMAKNDPHEALVWARANEKGHAPIAQMTVLNQIAGTDPQLALAEALETPDERLRSNLVANVIQTIARNNPADAAVYVDQMQDRNQKAQASAQLAAVWVRKDPDAAMDWILSQDKETAGRLVQMAAQSLLQSDIDTVIRLLPRVAEEHRPSLRLQIAQQLVTSRSPGEAQNFILQFEGQPGFEQLQESVISAVAQTDAVMAKQLADQLADVQARDRAYAQVIAQHAQTNPVEAAHWLNNVSDDKLRGQAASQLAAQWYGRDPAAAMRWVYGLPAGSSRDDAVIALSRQWSFPTAEQEELIASIEDRNKRGQAKMQQIYRVLQTDPARARKLLDDEDIPSSQRQEIETMIDQYESRF